MSIRIAARMPLNRKEEVVTMPKDNKMLRYRIKVTIDVPANDPAAILKVNEFLAKAKEYGTAEVSSTQIVTKDAGQET